MADTGPQSLGPARRGRWAEAALLVARAGTLSVGVVVAVTVATGWLYWLRQPVAFLPGPRVSEALPLDELPGHASVPLLVYLVVFAIAGVALGLLARACRIERLTATLALAFGVGITLFVFDVFSLYVVRQVSLPSAVRHAAPLDGIYLAAALAGVAAGLLARGTPEGRTWCRVLAAVVALAGLGDLVAAIAPPTTGHAGLLPQVAAVGSPAVDDAILVPVGVLLLASARGLSRGRRPAYLLAISLLAVAAVLLAFEAQRAVSVVLSASLALLLFARRQDFTSPAGPRSARRAVGRLAVMLLAAVAVGTVALVVNAVVADLPFDPWRALTDTGRVLVGVPTATTKYLPPSFTTWFPWAIRLVAVIGALWAAEVWLAPWRQPSSAAGERLRAARIVQRWGTDTLAPFTLRADKALFFYDPARTGQPAVGTDAVVIAYRVVEGMALMSGDPVGPHQLIGPALDAFVTFVHHHGWQLGVLGASAGLRDLCRSRGFRVIQHGDEAVVDVASFSLAGGHRRAVRQAVSRLERRGYVSQVVYAGDAAPSLRDELVAIERAWLKGQPRRGFSMELDDLFRLGGHDALFVVGRSPDGQVAGFLHLACCPASRVLSLSSMPRRATTPNGFNSWLIVEAVRWCAQHRYDAVSLNFSPFASLLAAEALPSLAGRIERDLLLRVKVALSLQLDNLERFNHQFGPRTIPRYVAFEHRSDLPLLVLAAMEAEGYLPLAERVRSFVHRELRPRRPHRPVAGRAAEGAAAPGPPGPQPGAPTDGRSAVDELVDR